MHIILLFDASDRYRYGTRFYGYRISYIAIYIYVTWTHVRDPASPIPHIYCAGVSRGAHRLGESKSVGLGSGTKDTGGRDGSPVQATSAAAMEVASQTSGASEAQEVKVGGGQKTGLEKLCAGSRTDLGTELGAASGL